MSAAIDEAILAELRAMREEIQALRREQARSQRALHTRTAAARILGMQRSQLDLLVEQGKIRTVVGPGGKPRVPQAEIERLEREGFPAPRRRGRPRKQAENQPVRLSDWKPGR